MSTKSLYKLHFLSTSFKQKVFHPPTFSNFQPNTQEGKLYLFSIYLLIFYPLTFPLLLPNRSLVNKPIIQYFYNILYKWFDSQFLHLNYLTSIFLPSLFICYLLFFSGCESFYFYFIFLQNSKQDVVNFFFTIYKLALIFQIIQ